MNNGIKCLFAFSFGAAIGSVVTWKIIKSKYEQIANNEIASVKEVYSRRNKKTKNEPEKSHDNLNTKPIFDKSDVAEYAEFLSKQGYTNYSDIKETKNEVKPEEATSKPYVITPEEFGEKDGYEISNWTYYNDGILADENDEAIEDIDYFVGYDSLKHFGEYEDDSVHVRNDKLKHDYEILLDVRNYVDVCLHKEE